MGKYATFFWWMLAVPIALLVIAAAPGKPKGYLVFGKKANDAWVYEFTEGGSFTHYYTDTAHFNQHVYRMRVRVFSWGGNADTNYVREDAANYYLYNQYSDTETVMIPKQPKVGFQWYELDSIWGYTVLETNGKFVTPKKTYKRALVIEARSHGDFSGEVFRNYYVRGVGYVGSVQNGELLCYLGEVRKGKG